MLQHPNVIFVITDDQGYGDVACHGNPVLKTPHLDQMARESVQLDNHHHDPLCSPSRAALLTGQYASRNGVWHVIHGRHLLHPEAITMADIFSDNGYRTGMFGKWHLGDNVPFAPQYRGFDEVLCHRGGGVGELPDYWGNSYMDDSYFHHGRAKPCTGYCTDVFFQAALNFIEANQRQPFFVYLATNAMHAPFVVPEQYAAPYKAQGMAADRANFYGMIANFDENMGRLFRRLKELDLDENTIVIFTSDHGTAAGFDPASGEGYNAGLRGKKGSVYDGGHQVNFFLRWHNTLPAAKKVVALTAHIDILPTLMDLCRLKPGAAPDFDGLSLAAHLQDESAALPERSVFVHLQPDQPQKWHHCVVMRGRWRLVNGEELYDMQEDRGQQWDVSPDFPQVVAALRREYESWWAGLQNIFAEYIHIPVGTEQENPSLLSARDWHPTQGSVPWRQAWIGDPAYDANGFWMIDVVQAGLYVIELRSYPRGANLPMGLVSAELKIGSERCTQAIREGDALAAFRLELPAGKCAVQTRLADGAGQRELGAYYTYFCRL